VYRDAEAIYNMKPVDIRGYSYIDRQFEVRNRRATASHVGGVDFRPYSAVTENGKKALGKQNVIREKEASAFFDVINGSQRIKMPSANLHRLGGKSFISKMNDMGYTMSAHADGSFVDADGMIVWEKDDG
jgi:hypothetical protein